MSVTGKHGTAPCGHAGEYVIGQYVRCLEKWCDGSSDAVPQHVDREITEKLWPPGFDEDDWLDMIVIPEDQLRDVAFEAAHDAAVFRPPGNLNRFGIMTHNHYAYKWAFRAANDGRWQWDPNDADKALIRSWQTGKTREIRL